MNGKGTQTKMTAPFGLWWNSAENCLYVCDRRNNTIRKINLQGISSLFADFLLIFILLQGEASTFAQGGSLNTPNAVVVHHNSHCTFVANFYAHNILKITSTGVYYN